MWSIVALAALAAELVATWPRAAGPRLVVATHSPAIAQTLARETGAKVAVLDPLEGLTDASKGSDYLEVMRSNLATLKDGQGCS